MNNALFYVIQHFFFHLFEFFRHWYVKSMKIYSNFVIDQLQQLDYSLAWRITLKHLFEPLYRDYTVLGYILGFGFRVGRLVVGGFIYLIIFAVAIGLYLFWLAIPIYIISRIFF